MADPEGSAWGESADVTLEILARLANQQGRTKQSVSLYLPGMIVCGEIVGAFRWYKSQADNSDAAARGTDDPDLLAMSAMQETTAEAEQALANAMPPFPKGTPPSLIHIEVQSILVGSARIIPPVPFVWRGRLSQVVGWHYGIALQP